MNHKFKFKSRKLLHDMRTSCANVLVMIIVVCWGGWGRGRGGTCGRMLDGWERAMVCWLGLPRRTDSLRQLLRAQSTWPERGHMATEAQSRPAGGAFPPALITPQKPIPSLAPVAKMIPGG